MPSLPPPRTTELYYSGAWHTISGDMRESAPVTITRGATAIGRRADPTAATATLDNRSGDYSPRNPLSDLFGKIGRNTPWRFSVNAGGPRLDLSSTAYTLSTPDAASLDILGDIDVRIDVAPTRWTSAQMLVNRYAVGGNLAWSLMLTPTGRLLFNWSATGLSGSTYAVSTIPVPGGRRRQLRATLDVNNGASGSTVTFYVASGRGGWVQLGDPVVRAGTTAIYNATAPLHIGDPVAIAQTPAGDPLGRLVGSVYGVQVFAGISGVLRVDVAPEDQATPGAASFTDATARAWTLTGGATLSNRHIRMEGEIPAWPPSRDLSGADRTVQIAPAGIMRRLGSGNRPLDSALRRFIIGNGPVECWPLADGEQATQGSSLVGAPPLVSLEDTAPEWGKGELASWIEPTIAFTPQTSGILQGRPLTAGATTSWSVDFCRAGAGLFEIITILDSGRATDSDPRTQWRIMTTLPLDSIRLFREVRTSDAVSTALLGEFFAPGIFDAQPHHFRLSTAVVGSSTTWVIYIDGESIASGTAAGTSRPVGQVTFEWDLVDGSSTPELSLGFLTVWPATAPAAADVYAAMGGFTGETAGARMLRLSAENGVVASLVGVVDVSEPLGVQEPQRFLETLDTIAESDLGMVLEQRDARALVYRPRHTLYNQVPTLTLDFANGEISAPFAPIDDDKLTENDVTVTRKGGASATAVRTDGPLSVDAIGRYDVAPEVSLATDGQTVQQAYWRMHVGTFDGLRYTKITIDLGNARAYALVNDALAVDVGDVIRLQRLPADQQPGDVDLIVTGYEEEVGATAWRITYTCVPGEPWTVGIAGDPILGRADTAGSALASSATSTATALSVATTAGPVWTPDLQQYPFDLTVGGEVVTAVSIGTVITPNPLLLDDLSGWAPLSATLDYSTAVVHTAAGATASLLMTPTGATSASATTSPTSPVGSITPGASYTMCGWVYSPAGWSDMRIVTDWNNAADVLVSTSPSVAIPVPAGVWTWISVTATAPALASRARVRARIGASPAVSDLSYWWGVRLVATASVSTTSPQTMTVVRSVNGITKAHASGTPLSLTHPMRAAL